MRKFFSLLSIVALIAITGCTSQQTASVTSTIASICKAAQPVVLAASTVGTTNFNDAAASLAKYVTASCNVDGTVAASLVPNVTGSTPVWLTNVLTDFTTVANIALPLLPALLAII